MYENPLDQIFWVCFYSKHSGHISPKEENLSLFLWCMSPLKQTGPHSGISEIAFFEFKANFEIKIAPLYSESRLERTGQEEPCWPWVRNSMWLPPFCNTEWKLHIMLFISYLVYSLRQFVLSSYHEGCSYTLVWANNAHCKNGSIHLAFPAYKLNADNSSITSLLAPSSNFQRKWNTP